MDAKEAEDKGTKPDRGSQPTRKDIIQTSKGKVTNVCIIGGI